MHAYIWRPAGTKLGQPSASEEHFAALAHPYPGRRANCGGQFQFVRALFRWLLEAGCVLSLILCAASELSISSAGDVGVPDPVPVANNDSFTLTQGSTLSVAGPGVLGNDTGPTGVPLTALLVWGATNGLLLLNQDGSFIYTPTTGFTGVDAFTYEAVTSSATSRVATVSLLVQAQGPGISAVWKALYGAYALDPDVDTDGDGVVNRLEALAGTDPFDPGSVFKLTALSCSGTNVTITLNTAPGKRYELQSIAGFGIPEGTNWTTQVIVTNQTAVSLNLTVPFDTPAKFFRVAVSDVDSDGDGLTDWEEYQLGLDPYNGFSNGHTNTLGNLLTDYAYLTNGFHNSVTIKTTGPTATQPSPGEGVTNAGAFTLTRTGVPLFPIDVNLSPAGPGWGMATEGIDYQALPRSITIPQGVRSQVIALVPMSDTNLVAPALVTLTLQGGGGYMLGAFSNASIVIYPAPSTNGSGLTGQYFAGASTNYTDSANFNPTNLALTQLDPVIDFDWRPLVQPFTNGGNFTVRWTGQVQPRFSELYTFVVNSDEGVRLWVNDQRIIDDWTIQTAQDSSGSIYLLSGVRYDIRLEYFNFGGPASVHLGWYSASQAKQMVPPAQLYPATSEPAPTAITSPLTAVAFLGQPFAYNVTAVNTATSFSASPLPPGLNFNSTNGILAGTPSVAGEFHIILLASNSVNVAGSTLALQVVDTGSTVSGEVVREVWTAVPGSDVSDIPLQVPADIESRLTSLEGSTNYGQNYAERVRGYITPQSSGNYYFWLAAGDSAELWISDDSEAVNKVLRAWVTPSGHASLGGLGTGSREWNVQRTQKSAWLALNGGQRYYVEVLHKAGLGTNGNFAVGWLQDATGTNTGPIQVVQGAVLSPYFAPPATVLSGTVFAANLLEQANASTAVGSASLKLSGDGTEAVLNVTYGGLSSSITGRHIHSDPYLSYAGQILFDIDSATPREDGSYAWALAPVGPLAVADIQEIIRQGKAFVNIHTVNYPGGEISGHFTLVNGSQNFTPPPPPPSWIDDHASADAAARFLIQASFGPSPMAIAEVQELGYSGWISNQLSLPASHLLPYVYANASPDPAFRYPTPLTFSAWWQQAVTAPDQLRQRLAFALSEILVVSVASCSLGQKSDAVASYYDTLLDHAFDNFRNLMDSVTLSPAMGRYLDMRGNDKGDPERGTRPNENFARELLQLFSLGLNRLWPDGSFVMDSKDNIVPTYDQQVVMGFASVFTGWNYYQPNRPDGRLPFNWSPSPDYTHPMVLVPTHHELGTKRLLDNVMLPAAQGSQADFTSTNFDQYGLQELKTALDAVFNHPNVGPFICRQLIQRFVTSNPSRDYVYRVVQVFNDNGAGVRGDMRAVLQAILLDYEARSTVLSMQPTFGKQREPLLRATAVARAFPVTSLSGVYSQNGTPLITITTTNPHHLSDGNNVFLSFNNSSGQIPPTSRTYGVTVNGPSSFTIVSDGLLQGTFERSNQMITVTAPGHHLAPGSQVYLSFLSGMATSGVYEAVTVLDNSTFSVPTAQGAESSGSCVVPVTSGGYTISASGTMTITSVGNHGLNVSDPVYLSFTSGTASNGIYSVSAVADSLTFNVTCGVADGTQGLLDIYPLKPPPMVRSGNVGVQQSLWTVGYTDNSLAQTPLASPTVFNFFYPSYRFPGVLAAAGLTTPEFQLTSEATVTSQMNFLAGGVLSTNGLSSFVNGNGAIALDLGPWLTPDYTSTTSGVASLVDSLSTLLLANQLSAGARRLIIQHVTDTNNFPVSSPPTSAQIRDRVQAAVHLIVTSPDFTIQR